MDTRENAGTRDVTLRINDRIAPEVSLMPKRGKAEVEPGKEIVLRATARDEIGIEKIDLLVDGTRVQTRDIASLLETIQDFKVPIDRDIVLGREVKVQAAVHDAAGNVGGDVAPGDPYRHRQMNDLGESATLDD